MCICHQVCIIHQPYKQPYTIIPNRSWILFFHVQWSYESINDIWRAGLMGYSANAAATHVFQIDRRETKQTDAIAKNATFYIANVDSFGNAKKVFSVVMCIIYPLIILLIDVLPLLIWKNISLDIWYIQIIHIVILCAVLFLVFYWAYKISLIQDKQFIGPEFLRINLSFGMKFIFICVSCVFSLIIALLVLTNVLNIILSTNNNLIAFLSTIISLLALCLALFWASYWTWKKMHQMASVTTMKQIENERKSNVVDRFIRTSIISSTTTQQLNDNKLNEITLNETLSIKKGFEVFAQFLISELSVENILFLVEVKQYKAVVRL